VRTAQELEVAYCGEFQEEFKDTYKVLLGGDSTLAGKWREGLGFNAPTLLPIRNYGRCRKHGEILDILEDARRNRLTVMEFPPFTACGSPFLSEFQLKSQDISQALRFDIEVNGKTFAKNIIADGIVAATRIGATGYFKSITRTVFRKGWGLAIVNPTYSVVNQVLTDEDVVRLIFRRGCKGVLAWDKDIGECNLGPYKKSGMTDIVEIGIGKEYNPVKIAGYDVFMCSECRKLRNSSIVNDQYIV